MKSLVVYYSRTGKNRTLAQYLSEKYRFQKDEIFDLAKRGGYGGFLKSGFTTMMRIGTKIAPRKIDPIDYENIIICSPIWVGILPPAIRTYIKSNKERIRNIIFVSISGVGRENTMLKNDFKSVYGKFAKKMFLFSETEFENDSWKEKVDEYIKSLNVNHQI